MKTYARIAMLLAAAVCIAAGATDAHAAAGDPVGLNVPFHPDVRTYSATVPNDVSEITVVAEARHEGATVTVNGGSPSTPVKLAVGANAIAVVVTAEDGKTRLTYTVTVTREAGTDGGTSPQVAAYTVPDSLIRTVRMYYGWNRNNPGGGENWFRVLIAFGAETHPTLTPFTVAEAEVSVTRWSGWQPILDALRKIEAANASPPPAPAVPAVSLSAAPNPVAEGSPVRVTATLSAALANDVTVPLTLTDGTAEAGDRGTLAGILIPAGFTSATGTVTTADDADADDETFTVALGALPAAVTAGSASSVAVTITDGDTSQPQVLDPPAVSIAAGPAVTEGGSAGFTLSADRAPAADLAVSVTVSQQGAVAEASALGARTVTIPAGRTTAAFAVATVNDAADEADGAVTAAVGAGSGYAVGAAANATVAVADDDVPAVTIAAGSGVTEGGSAAFTLRASPAPATDLAVSVTVSQQGAFADAAALGARTVTVPAGQASVSFAVATVDDAVDEPDGAVSAAVGAGGGYAVGAAASATVAVADDDVLEVTIAAGPAVTEGADAGFTLTAAPAPATDLAVAVTVSQRGAFAAPSALGPRTVTIPAGSTSAAFAVATVNDAEDEPDGGIVAAVGAGSGYTVGGTARASVAVADDDVSAPELLTRRAIAVEGKDDAAVFRVRLSHAGTAPVSVDWSTADGAGSWARTAPARAGADYTASSGTVSFAAGETQKTFRVPILDDAIDEGTEYFLVRFSNPRGGTLAARERETQGLIRNNDHLQKMWLSRFGRTVGSQVTDAVSGRLETGLAPGAHATLAGQNVNLAEADEGKALTDVLTGLAQTFGAPAANDPGSQGAGPGLRAGGAGGAGEPFARPGIGGRWDDPAAGTAATARSVTGRELLLGSSFHVAGKGGGAGPGFAAWGRVAHGSFDGQHADDTGRTNVDGEVVTGTLGADADWGRLLAGVAVSFSDGDGSFNQTGVDKGSIESTMTTVSPYARYRITERVSAWGLAGWGTGAMTIVQDALPADPAAGRNDPRPRTVTKTDLSMQLGAIGARGDILKQDAEGGMDLALKADAFFVRTEWEKVSGETDTAADASRVRLVLEGGRTFAVSDTATLRPMLELGVRHDGGDAETGAGLEVGGGVQYSDAASGFSLDARARMLAAHADSDYREWGASATARLDPGERGHGLSFSLSPVIGVSSSASERLWGARDARGLAPGGEFVAGRGLSAEAGYGLGLFGDRFTGTPNVGFGMSDGGARDYRIGWRLNSAIEGDPGFEVNLDATRREAANDNGAEHGIMLRSLIRW